jgi:hypothetical protein
MNACTYGIPPDKCGKAAVTYLPGNPELFFCVKHTKIARNAFSSLKELRNPRAPKRRSK